MDPRVQEFQWLNQEWIAHLFTAYGSMTHYSQNPTVPEAGDVYVFHNVVINHALGTRLGNNNAGSKSSGTGHRCGDNGGIVRSGRPCGNPVAASGALCRLHTSQSFSEKYPRLTQFTTVEVHWICDGFMPCRTQVWLVDDLYDIVADGEAHLSVDCNTTLSFPHTALRYI